MIRFFYYDRMSCARGLALAVMVSTCLPRALNADIVRLLDVVSVDKTRAAKGAWEPGTSDPAAASAGIERERLRRMLAVSSGEAGGAVFPCPFADVGLDRVFWDRRAWLDLTDFHLLEIELSCERPDAVRTIVLYLKSGDGWYLWQKPIAKAGRQRISLPVKNASVEGRPGGWNRITSIRVAFTRASNVNAGVEIHSLRARACDVALVEGTVSVPVPSERASARGAARRMSLWLDELGIPYALMDDEDVIAGKLRKSRVAILPYNPFPPASQIAELAAFVERGGRLIVFYSSSPELAGLMGMRLGEYKAEKEPGEWSSFSFNSYAPPHMPAAVFQASRNIRPVYPASRGAGVIAYWRDANGLVGPDPAWVQSNRGFWMSHILLDGDAQGKKNMMLGMLGFCEETVWIAAARHAMENAGRVGMYQSFQAAISGIARRASDSPHRRAVRNLLARSRMQFGGMSAAWERRNYPEVISSSASFTRSVVEAYAMVQKPAAGEMRGVWDHSGTGLYPGDWNRTCRILSDNGFNAIFPNVSWPGHAHYMSRSVPVSPLALTLGDQLEQCLSAAARYGISVHAWKVCWNLGHAPEDWIDKLKKNGRLQQSASGATLNWLCPSNPENIALELNAIMEMVRNYKIHGIHLDYIRYPDANSCYCRGCRLGFEHFLGRPARDWPGSAATGGLREEFISWRAGRITEFVRAARAAARRINPTIKISAAVYPMYPGCINSVGQDWGYWLAEGLVDFVCPMNYTPDTSAFRDMSCRQLSLPNAKGRVFPGIGVTAAESRLAADRVIDQIDTARSCGAGGFVLFDLNRTLEHDVLPMLRLGITRDP